jgi:hypothetical protein
MQRVDFILNCDRYNNSCTAKGIPLTCETFDFLRTQECGCKMEENHFINMATGNIGVSVVEDISSHAFCKFATTVSSRQGISGVIRPNRQSPPFL